MGGLLVDIAGSRLQARLGSPCPDVLTQPAWQLDRDAEQLCEQCWVSQGGLETFKTMLSCSVDGRMMFHVAAAQSSGT